MKKELAKTQKSTARRGFEFALLLISLCVLVIRATYPESPNTSTVDRMQAFSNEGLSLLISSVLVFSIIAWLAAAFFTGKLNYRYGWIEIGTGLFILAGIMSIFAASNKRAAITDFTTITAVMLTAVMLVQILDSEIRIKLALMTIIACAAATTFQAFEQYQTGNEMMIEQYEENPQIQLDQLGIEPGTFQHFSYEHRLYSKDVRGFLTTGNSVGSFMLLALFASASLFWKRYATNPKCLIIAIVLTVLILFGLAITRSKGAMAALLVSSAMAAAYLLFPETLKKYRKLLLIFCLIIFTALITITVNYGMEHDTLPGGNSMLVRWQYWSAAVKVFLLKPISGVGGGNFGSYYTHFKLPEALETVKDPHNFLLSLLSQYGPLGLAGFCLAFMLPMFKLIFSPQNLNPKLLNTNNSNKRKMILTAISVLAAMLIFRPFFLQSDMGNTPFEIAFVIFYLFLLPAIVTAIAFMLMIIAESDIDTSKPSGKPLAKTVGPFMFCALAGVAIHNLIDFAIFEPGVSTAFWIAAACIAAWQLNRTGTEVKTINISSPVRITAICALLIAGWGFCSYVLIPPVVAGKLRQESVRDIRTAHQKLELAAKIDPLSPTALNLNGRAYIQQFIETGRDNPALLNLAAEKFTKAANRDKANYVYYENISEAYYKLAKNTTPERETGYLETAMFWMKEALKRYPASDRLNYQAAVIAESLGRNAEALIYYRKTVEIEEEYREIFKVMYPEREIFSRLGEEKFQNSKSKIKQLQ